MGHEAAKIASHNAVPGGALSLVELSGGLCNQQVSAPADETKPSLPFF